MLFTDRVARRPAPFPLRRLDAAVRPGKRRLRPSRAHDSWTRSAGSLGFRGDATQVRSTVRVAATRARLRWSSASRNHWRSARQRLRGAASRDRGRHGDDRGQRFGETIRSRSPTGAASPRWLPSKVAGHLARRIGTPASGRSCRRNCCRTRGEAPVREFCRCPLRLGKTSTRSSRLPVRTARSPRGADLVDRRLSRSRWRSSATLSRTWWQRQAAWTPHRPLQHRFLIDSLGSSGRWRAVGSSLAILMLDIDHSGAQRHARSSRPAMWRSPLRADGLTTSGVRTGARYGGEEFVVLMPKPQPRTHSWCREDPCRGGGDEVELPTRGGAPHRQRRRRAYPQTRQRGRALRLATKPLYEAKRMGRDRTCLACEPALSMVQDARVPTARAVSCQGIIDLGVTR